MKNKLTQRMWAIKYKGDKCTPPNFKIDGFYLTKQDAMHFKKFAYNSPDFKIVRVQIVEE